MTPVHLEINEYIMQKINSGEWPIDYMIPTEIQFCEQFGVSRPTVRIAIMKLVQEGYLRRIKGKGTFVTTPRVLEQSTVFIESFFREMRQRGVEISTEVLEFRMMPSDCEPAVKERLNTKDEKLIKLARLRYVKGSFDKGPIVLTTSYFTSECDFLFQYDFESVSMTDVLNENGKKRKRIEKELTALALGGKEGRLLGVEEGTLAMRIVSVSKDKDEQVVETTESLYPLERNRFILKLQL